MELNKVIDASSIFFQESQLGIVENLYSMVQNLEIYDQKDLFNIIRQLNNIGVTNLPEEARSKFQTLYGRVHTLSVNHMVDKIYEEATALSSGEYSSSEELAHRTQTLKEMLADVWSNNSLSTDNSNFLRIALVKLAKLFYQIPSLKKNNMVHHPQASFIKDEDMLPKSEVIGAVVTPDWEKAELSIEILQVAQLLYQKHPEGIMQFRRLPQDIQQELGPVDDSAEYIRRMVITSMQMVRKDGYSPSQEEIELMFAEAPPVA